MRMQGSILLPSIFSGRDEELKSLRRGVSQSFQRCGRSFVVVGAAGIGKTRLLREVVESAAQEGADFFTIEHAFLPAGTANPSLFKSLLKQCLSHFQCVTKHESQYPLIADKIGLMHPFVRETFFDLAGKDTKPNSIGDLDENTRRTLASSVIWDVVNYLSTIKPIILIIEDIHWGSIDLKFFLQNLDMKLDKRKITLFLSTRDASGGLFKEANYLETIHLSSMNPDMQMDLLDKWLGYANDLDLLKSEIINVCNGNPLFIHEIVSGLARNGDLSGEPGNFLFAGQASASVIPKSLKELVEAQLHFRTESQKLLLECAAVIGLRFDLTLISSLTKDFPGAAAELEELVQSKILYKDQDSSNIFFFTHALIQDAIYDAIPGKRREQIHAALLKIFTAGPRTRERVALCAHHAAKAQLFNQAFVYNYIAGNHAITACDGALASNYFEVALENLERLPSHFKNKSGYIIKCQIGLAFALSIQGRHADARTLLTRAQSGLNDLETRPEKVQNKLKSLGLFDLWIQGDLLGGIEIGREFLKGLDIKEDPYDYVTTSIRLAGMFQDCGRYADSNEVLNGLKDFFNQNNASVRYGILFPPSAACHAMMSRNYGELGQYDQAEMHAQKSRSFMAYNRNALSAIYGLSYSATYLIRQEKFTEALPFLSDAHWRCSQIKASLLYPFCASHYGFVLFRSGKSEEGFALMEEACEISGKQSAFGRKALYIQMLSEARFLNDEYDVAEALALKAIETGKKYFESANIARAYYVLGLAKIQTGRQGGEGAADLRTAERMAEDLNLQPLLSVCSHILKVRAA